MPKDRERTTWPGDPEGVIEERQKKERAEAERATKDKAARDAAAKAERPADDPQPLTKEE